MTVRRVMGTEVEYGVSVPHQPDANPMVISSHVVNGYGSRPEATGGSHAHWDFEEESPLRDARGFTYAGQLHDPAENLTEEDAGLANVILTNGARLYVDHAHPEYSTPECTSPRDVLVWDKAGERIMAIAAATAAQIPGTPQVNLYKNNTDNKGASYGTHENYLVQRSVPWGELVRFLTPFLVTRQVICGAGRVGIGQDGRQHGYQISQRADFFETEVGLETTLKRPIVNTRDEPHADASKYRRLHVIIGDANLAEISTLLKVGTTSLMLSMIEDEFLDADLSLSDPVSEVHAVSHDLTLEHKVTLRDGRRMRALDVQELYWEYADAYVTQRGTDDATREVLALWADVLQRLRRDPMEAAEMLDWVAKLRLLNSYRERDNLTWDSPRLGLIDLQYSDVRPHKGLYYRLVERGHIQRLTTDEEINAAITTPPSDTRAYFRGRVLEKFGEYVTAASWDSVIFDTGGNTLTRVPMMEPQRGTAEHVGELLDRTDSVTELLHVLTGGAQNA